MTSNPDLPQRTLDLLILGVTMLPLLLAVFVSLAGQDWQLSSTDHFDITYPPELAAQVTPTGLQAERAYRQVSTDLQRDLSLRPLLVLFSTRADLERAVATRTVPQNREHLLLALDVPVARLEGTLLHELSHIFLFDVIPAGSHREIPQWIVEGLAEYQRGEWDASDLAVIQELVRTGSVPRIDRLAALPQPGEAHLNVVVGHAAFDFIASRIGKEGVRRFFLTLADNPSRSPATTVDDFDRAFEQYLRTRFQPQR